MSNAEPSRETRSIMKTNQWRAAINQIMDKEETPAWAQHLLTEFANFRSSFDTKMTEVTNSIKDLKKDTRAMNNRISNAESRIGTLETETNSENEKIKALHKNMDALQIKMDNIETEFRKKNLMFISFLISVLNSLLKRVENMGGLVFINNINVATICRLALLRILRYGLCGVCTYFGLFVF